jgi:hypothetical protein
VFFGACVGSYTLVLCHPVFSSLAIGSMIRQTS